MYITPPDAQKSSYARQCKLLAAAKKDIPELAVPHPHLLQQALRILEAIRVGRRYSVQMKTAITANTLTPSSPETSSSGI